MENSAGRFLACLTGSAAVCTKIVLSCKLAEKPNEEANSQSSQLAREEDLQNSWAMVEIMPVIAPWPAAR